MALYPTPAAHTRSQAHTRMQSSHPVSQHLSLKNKKDKQATLIFHQW